MSTSVQPTCQIDNETTRVTECRFAPGAATGHHRHDFDYVVVPMTSGRLRIVGPDGAEAFRELASGQSYFGTAGTEHDVFSASDHEVVFLEVEFKVDHAA